MKNKYYYPYQLYSLLLIFAGIVYAVFLWVQYQHTIQYGVLVEKTISSVNCRPYRRLVSSIQIKENNKLYYIKIDYESCQTYSANEKISLWYYKAKDLYLYPAKKPNHVRRIILLIILFIIVLIPWLYIIRKYTAKEK